MTVKPTPTQAEMDAHARHEYIDEHEHDGSPVQHHAMPGVEAKKPSPVTVFADPSSAVAAAVAAQQEPQPEAEPPKAEEKAADADKHRATYKTRRAKASDDEEDKAD